MRETVSSEMTTHTASCKPELISLGKCMLQGFVGGILATLAVILFLLVRGLRPESLSQVLWGALPLTLGGFLGAIKAIPFWAVNCFRRSPLRVVARITLGGIGLTSLWLWLLIAEDHLPIETLVVNAGLMFLLSLPTSLLIGSRTFFTSRVGGLPNRIEVLRTDIPTPRPAIACDPEHQCLGSRFAEWQQRVA